jgi:hypothetical protein
MSIPFIGMMLDTVVGLFSDLWIVLQNHGNRRLPKSEPAGNHRNGQNIFISHSYLTIEQLFMMIGYKYNLPP